MTPPTATSARPITLWKRTAMSRGSSRDLRRGCAATGWRTADASVIGLILGSETSAVRQPVAAHPRRRSRLDPLDIAVRFQSVIGLALVAVGGVIFSPRRHGLI